MQISRSSFFSINNKKNFLYNKQLNNKPNQLKNDVFIKNCSFGQTQTDDIQSFKNFKKWSDEVDFPSFANEVISTTGRIMGYGLEAKTYEIPYTDDWVIRQYKRSRLLNFGIEKPEIVEIKDITPALNVGQFIASVHLPVSDRLTQQFYVMKRQSGDSLGVSYSRRNDVDNLTTKQHLTSLNKLANLPQKSFDKLIKDIKYVTEQGYKFDCTDPGNFLLDEDTQSINFINVEDKLGHKENTQFGDVLFALLGGEFAVEFNKSDRPQFERDEAMRLSQRICSMFMISMVKHQQEFTLTNKFLDALNTKAFENILGATSQDDKIAELSKLELC